MPLAAALAAIGMVVAVVRSPNALCNNLGAGQIKRRLLRGGTLSRTHGSHFAVNRVPRAAVSFTHTGIMPAPEDRCNRRKKIPIKNLLAHIYSHN
jgi:hypothetical protein